MIIAIAITISSLLAAVYLIVEYWQKNKQLSNRISQYSQYQKPAFSWQSVLRMLPVTDKDKQELGLLLQQAGFRQPEAIFILVAIKLVGLIAFPLLVFVYHYLQQPEGLSLALLFKCTIAALIGSMSAEWWLKSRANHNRELMRAATPDAVDLMVICAESGLHLDSILQRVGEEIDGWSAQLSEELLFTCAQLNMGLARPDALNNLSKRIDTEEFKHLVSALIQSDRYGTPLVKTLKDLAQDIRRIRTLTTEEKIGKVPATMSLPLMLFVLFPLVVLLAAPAMISLVRSLQGM
jgi:tight adherence protein C